MQTYSRPSRAARGAFTLIELLVVVSIIALLIAVLLPSLAKARRQAKGVVCESNQRNLMLAVAIYTENNRGHFPTAGLTHGGQDDDLEESWVIQLAEDYGKDEAIARCPMDESPSWTTPNIEGRLRRTSFANHAYLVYPIADRDPYDRYEVIKRPATTVFWVELTETGDYALADHVHPELWWFGEPEETASDEVQTKRHDGRANYAFIDGHAERMGFSETYKVDPDGGFPPLFLRNKYDPLIGN